MEFYLIETEAEKYWNREVLGIYVEGFVNKQLLIDTYTKTYDEEHVCIVPEGSSTNNIRKLTVEDIKYQWCRLKEDEGGEVYSLLSDKEEIGSFGVTAIYW